MVQDTQAYTEYPIPQDRGLAEPQLDGPSGGEMDAPAKLIVTYASADVNDVRGWTPPPGKARILDALAPSELVAIADNLIFELANARAEIIAIRGALRTAAEAIAAQEATLMLSDGYAAGKNAEVRAAWLKSQRLTDLAFRALVEAESGLSGQLAVAEAAESTLLRRWDLARAEIRLAESTLRFLAEV